MLKQGDGPDLLIQGSSTIYPALLAAGLLDRLVLYTFPILLGSGKRLFGEGTPSGTLKLVGYQVCARRHRHRNVRACRFGPNGVLRSQSKARAKTSGSAT